MISKMLYIDCMTCRRTEEYNFEEQGSEIFCSSCFSIINTDTAETREPTKKELKRTAYMFDKDHSEFVLSKYYKGVNCEM
tara:strand:+ start:1148 stop:1387 length:240 start_codon:yes stop_codon:yes gene_type:complete